MWLNLSDISHAIHLGGQSLLLIYLVISVTFRKSDPFEIEKKKERKGPQTQIVSKTKLRWIVTQEGGQGTAIDQNSLGSLLLIDAGQQ